MNYANDMNYANAVAANDLERTACLVELARNALAAVSIWMFCASVGASDFIGPGGPQGIAADVSGNIYVADMRAHVIRKTTASGITVILAGSPGAAGFKDGVGAGARFNAPAGVAIDLEGYVYVADTDNHLIRRITPAGIVTTLAGQAGVPGSDDGSCSAAAFSSPNGVAVDQEGNVYVADMANSTIRKITRECEVSTLAGVAGVAGNDDGLGREASFRFPQDLATDRAGNVYVSDVNSHTIRKIAPNGWVSTLAGKSNVPGSRDGPAPEATFNFPRGITVDRANNIFVVDSNNYAIRKITPDGVVSTVMDRSPNAGMTLPAGIALNGTLLHVTLHGGVIVVQDLSAQVSNDTTGFRSTGKGL